MHCEGRACARQVLVFGLLVPGSLVCTSAFGDFPLELLGHFGSNNLPKLDWLAKDSHSVRWVWAAELPAV